jgi:hypothetical protein
MALRSNLESIPNRRSEQFKPRVLLFFYWKRRKVLYAGGSLQRHCDQYQHILFSLSIRRSEFSLRNWQFYGSLLPLTLRGGTVTFKVSHSLVGRRIFLKTVAPHPFRKTSHISHFPKILSPVSSSWPPPSSSSVGPGRPRTSPRPPSASVGTPPCGTAHAADTRDRRYGALVATAEDTLADHSSQAPFLKG